MLKIVVDSGSDITPEEAKELDVSILPLHVRFGEKDYLDGVDIHHQEFFEILEAKGSPFPATSMPSNGETMAVVQPLLDEGHDVLILTISSGISSTWSSLHTLFLDNPHVEVVDSRLAVAAMKILIFEANKYRDEGLQAVKARMEALISRVVILACPKTLDYLFKGGRLSRAGWIGGKLLSIIPLITFTNGKVAVHSKAHGGLLAMKSLAKNVLALGVDMDYPVYACYTKTPANVQKFIKMIDLEDKAILNPISCSIAAHWGPDSYGLIFVKKA